MADIDIYTEAIKTFGALPQMVVAIEECSELQKEITKIIRKKGDLSNLAEEIADVEIVIEELKYIFTIHGKVKEQKEIKLERLRNTIKEHQKGGKID